VGPSLLQVLLRLAQFAILALMAGGAAASSRAPGSGRRWWVFALVSGLVFALLVGLWRAWLRLLAFPRDGYGPLDADRERYDAYLKKVGRASRNRVARWKVQGRIRAALGRARTATDPERAEHHLEKAKQTLEEWRRDFRTPRGERRALERCFGEDWSALRTIKYASAAQAQLDHARGLKTERGRDRARVKAREYLRAGLADDGADRELLLRFGRESGLLDEQVPATPSLIPPSARWIGLGDRIEVAGRGLGGPLWVGSVLQAPGGKGPDAALIDPSLPVATRASRRDEDLPERPRYAELTPAQRAGYLDWLAGPRTQAGVPRAFPRLLLFGLERRLLGAEDPPSDLGAEVAGLVGELEHLAARHQAEDRRLATSARALALYGTLRFPEQVGAQDPPTELGPADGELPPRLRLALARRISAGQAVPVELARAWLHHGMGGALRTAAGRAPDDFERLFKLRYRERFGSGLVVVPGAVPLRVVLVPLSPSFGGESFQRHLDLPDPAACVGVVDRLDALADACCEELDGLSRYLGRAEGRPPDLKVLASLPRELLVWHDEPPLEALRALLAKLEDPGPSLVDTARLTDLWPRRGPLSAKDCTRYAVLLAKLGHGVEPDPRFGGGRWRAGGEVALFRLASDAPKNPSRAYEAAALVVYVAVALTAAAQDGQQPVAGAEEEALREHLESSLDLPAAERRRLEVHLSWLRRHPPRLAGLKRQVAGMEPDARDRLADFLLRVACADGRVATAEVRMLERLYELLGREPAQVHTDLHRRSSGGLTLGSPQQPDGLALDPARLAQKLAETRRVAALLGDVFSGEDELARPTRVLEEGPTYAGLDAAHSSFLARLGARESWPREQAQELAQQFGLLPDGALDALNDAAFEALGNPLWEGDDPLWIDTTLAAELMSA
jgi:uncharacterized tellurite resistance protein B-like protein